MTSILRSVGTFARSSARNFVRRRTSGVLGSIDSLVTKSSMQIRSSNQFQSVATTPLAGNVIAALSSQGGVSLRTAFERTRNPIARAVRVFLGVRDD